MQRRFPRANAGFSIERNEKVSSASSVEQAVWNSSMNKTASVPFEVCSSNILMMSVVRCSNSPLFRVPAISPFRSSSKISTSCRCAEDFSKILCASSSTMAVLPVPASPTNMQLGLRLRRSETDTFLISSSRPTARSLMPPFDAFSLRLLR